MYDAAAASSFRTFASPQQLFYKTIEMYRDTSIRGHISFEQQQKKVLKEKKKEWERSNSKKKRNVL